MHVRKLSSRQTFHLKFIFAPLLGMMSVVMLAILWHAATGAKSNVPVSVVTVVLLFWYGMVALFMNRVLRWKRVRLDTGGRCVAHPACQSADRQAAGTANVKACPSP